MNLDALRDRARALAPGQSFIASVRPGLAADLAALVQWARGERLALALDPLPDFYGTKVRRFG